MTPLLAIVGPTASGKTALAIKLGELLGGEVVSLDSQQVYLGMDIGTGKATREERARVKHHLLDVATPDEQMTAARFVELADLAIRDISARGKKVVLAGGTGLYYRALIFGLFPGPPRNPELRARFGREDLASLWARLKEVDSLSAGRIDPNDRIRITRALEVHELTGMPISWHQRHQDRAPRYEVKTIGLCPPKPELTKRIGQRVDEMIAAGLIDEVRALMANGYSPTLPSLGAIGYRQISSYLDGTLTLPEAVDQIKRATVRYARRQLAWFRSEPGITWYESPSEIAIDPLRAFP